MPTHPKGTESAAHKRIDNTDISNTGLCVRYGKWTTTVVRSLTTPRVPGGVRGRLLFDSGGLCSQAQGKRSFKALTELLNIIIAKLCNADRREVLMQF